MSAVSLFWLTLLVLSVSCLSALIFNNKEALARLSGTTLVYLSSLVLVLSLANTGALLKSS